MKLILILFSILLSNSCSSSKQNSVTPQNQPEQLSGHYQVTELGNNNTLPKDLTITFDETKNQVSGYSGCNRFFGSYTLDGNMISFGPLASTKRMCQEEANTIEHHFLTALNQVNGFSIENNKITLLNDKTPLLVAKQDNSYTIKYSAVSRGFFEEVNISNSTISFQKSRNSEPITKTTNNADWEKITALLEDIQLDSMSKLEAPTKAHQYDGAAIATLKIKFQGNTYETQSFDHGNPPEEIQTLVKEILSIAQNIE